MRRGSTAYRAVLLVGCAALLAGCSSGKSKATNIPPTVAKSILSAISSATTPTTAAPVTTTSAPASVDLSGSWSGKYSGAFTGTFQLSWQQTGSKLSGTITLSTQPGSLSLNGTVTGSQISFGTVGSEAITYSGSVSGNSMSGTYQVAGQAGGPWSATKAG
jgi:hypothetical protein